MRLAGFRHSLGLDGSVTFTLLARLLNILSSVGTVLLILRYLSPVEQGYYYTLLSLAALQSIFEMGFSFVILQLAAHETARLTLHGNGHVEGDPAAHGRLASVLQITVRWYSRAAVALAVFLLPLGIAFFARKSVAGSHVSWFGPWASAVLLLSLSFLLTPLYSFLEGCYLIRQVAHMRMLQALVGLIMSWAAIASGHGLYACAMVNLGVICVGALVIYSHRKLLYGLLHYRSSGHTVSWRSEVWPFQWKIGVVWLCTYFTMQIFTPILFVARGPQEAGRMGLSLSIVTYIPFLSLCWILPKAAPFGRLVNLGRIDELDRTFFRALKQSFGLFFAVALFCECSIVAAQHIVPKIASRIESPPVFVFLLMAAASSFFLQSFAVYLRSFKREPYLVLSLVVAGITTVAAILIASRWGSTAIAVDYFLVSGVFGLLWAAIIFTNGRKAAKKIFAALPGQSACDTQDRPMSDAEMLQGQFAGRVE